MRWIGLLALIAYVLIIMLTVRERGGWRNTRQKEKIQVLCSGGLPDWRCNHLIQEGNE